MSAWRKPLSRRPTAATIATGAPRSSSVSAPFVAAAGKMVHLAPPPAVPHGGRRFSATRFSLKSGSSTSFATTQRSEAPTHSEAPTASDSDQYDTDLEEEGGEAGRGRARKGKVEEVVEGGGRKMSVAASVSVNGDEMAEQVAVQSMTDIAGKH